MPAPDVAVSQDRIVAEIRARAGAAVVLPEADVDPRYLVDWPGDHTGRARALARPRTTDEVAAVLAACREAGVPVIVQGGHTGLVQAASPSADGTEVVLSLERMNTVRTIDTLGGFAVVEAGAVLAAFKEAVDRAGAYFPLSLGAEGSCRIGGNIGTNAGGVNVVRYGMMRDLVLGLEVVLADGRVLSDLRGLRKNNCGYDWKQLFIGAEGTLGIVTAACVKLFPRPTQVETLWLAAPSPAGVMEIYAHLKRTAGDLLSAFELIEGDAVAFAEDWAGVRDPLGGRHPAYALVELSATGGPELRPWLEAELHRMMETGLVPDGTIAESLDQTQRLWAVREGIVEAQSMTGRHLRTDVSVPIQAIAPFLAEAHAAIAALAPETLSVSYGHVGDGNIHFNVVRRRDADEAAVAGKLQRLEKEVNAIVDRHGGSISAEHGIGIAKRASFAARASAAELGLFRQLKAILDPDGVLAPDRIFRMNEGAAPDAP